VLLAIIMPLTGCAVTLDPALYLTNRYYDFRDTFDIGAGVTAENQNTGIIPMALGIHAQVTDFAQLGWIRFNGLSAESDMRGCFVGPEYYTRAGFFWWQYIQKNQDYEHGLYNVFKNKDFLWCTRMESYLMMLNGRPAKRLHYDHYAPYPIEGFGLTHQGWQYWGYTGLNVAICEPFLSHLGIMARVGIDPSEISDFLLGWFFIDFKGDDMKPEEFEQWKHSRFGRLPAPSATPASRQAQTPPPAPNNEATAGQEPPRGSQPAEPMRNEGLADNSMFAIIYFDYDRDVIRSDQVPSIEQNIAYLTSHPSVQLVMVIGHCDERGTTEYNYNLGMRRAQSVKAYMVKHGVDAARIQTQTRGKEEPVDLGHNQAAWAKNRRAETRRVIVIQTRAN
jgi:peptidoglycan-associated lipoprotein